MQQAFWLLHTLIPNLNLYFNLKPKNLVIYIIFDTFVLFSLYLFHDFKFSLN